MGEGLSAKKAVVAAVDDDDSDEFEAVEDENEGLAESEHE